MATYTNQAQLSYHDVITHSNVVTGELREALSGSKTAMRDTYIRGDNITYVISLVHDGNTPLSGLTLTDHLGAYNWNGRTLYPLSYVAGSARCYLNGAIQPAPVISPGPLLVFRSLSLPARGNLILIYEAQVNQYAPPGAKESITNTASLDAASLSLSETIHTRDMPELTISKSICPATVSENDTVTYTFVIQNTGNTPAAAGANVVVTDTFRPILSELRVALNGRIWNDPEQYRYNPATGLFSTVPGVITVPAASCSRNASGAWTVASGVSTLTVQGRLG